MRLTENKLFRIVKEEIGRVLNEISYVSYQENIEIGDDPLSMQIAAHQGNIYLLFTPIGDNIGKSDVDVTPKDIQNKFKFYIEHDTSASESDFTSGGRLTDRPWVFRVSMKGLLIGIKNELTY